MTTSRLATLPIDHVVAEMAAIPLASEAALRLALTDLDPELRERTAELWREAERQALGYSPAFSVDETVAIRDYAWFGDNGADNSGVPLHRYLQWLAKQFLEVHGPIAIPKLQREQGV